MKLKITVIALIIIILTSACSESKQSVQMTTVSTTPQLVSDETKGDIITARPSENHDDNNAVTSLSVSPNGLEFAVVTDDGRLFGWGEDFGNSGLWDIGRYPLHEFLAASDVASVNRGRWSLLYIDDSDTLWGIGWPMYWYFLPSEKGEYDEPIEIMQNVKMTAMGDDFFLALDNDGIVWTWGVGEYRLAGTTSDAQSPYSGTQADEPKMIMTDVQYISVYGDICYGIKADNTLWSWSYTGVHGEGGSIYFTQPQLIMNDVIHVSGGVQVFAVGTDGSLWAWGDTDSDMEVAGGSLPYFCGGEPQKIMDDVLYAAIGHGRYAVVTQSHDLLVWGDNRNGALGDGSDEYRREPYCVLQNVNTAVCGMNNILAIDNDGGLWEMGARYGTDYESTESADGFEVNSRLPHKIALG